MGAARRGFPLSTNFSVEKPAFPPGPSATQDLRAATTGERKNGAISPELRSS